jgi:hypothetical protein
LRRRGIATRKTNNALLIFIKMMLSDKGRAGESQDYFERLENPQIAPIDAGFILSAKPMQLRTTTFLKTELRLRRRDVKPNHAQARLSSLRPAH